MAEQKAKALMAGGVALFVTALVVLALFVIPAARHTQVAVAQDEGAPPAGEEAPGYPGTGGAVPGAIPGEEMGMGGEAGGGGQPAAPAGMTSEPLEPSRPNPFEPRAAAGVAAAAAASGATRYGPDWSRLPIAESMAFVRTEIPAATPPPTPVVRGGEEAPLRITSILWDASGQAQAAYETDEGRSGVLKPGDRIQGNTVVEITRTGVTLRNERTGATQTLELRARTKKPEPTTRPGQRPGGTRPGGGRAPRGFPAAPPG